jgi:hypothetical protein
MSIPARWDDYSELELRKMHAQDLGFFLGDWMEWKETRRRRLPSWLLRRRDPRMFHGYAPCLRDLLYRAGRDRPLRFCDAERLVDRFYRRWRHVRHRTLRDILACEISCRYWNEKVPRNLALFRGQIERMCAFCNRDLAVAGPFCEGKTCALVRGKVLIDGEQSVHMRYSKTRNIEEAIINFIRIHGHAITS